MRRSIDIDGTGIDVADVDIHCLVAATGAIWLADNTNGFLFRKPL